MQNIIKLITVSLLVFILGIFYLSLNRSSNYDTKFLVGNKIADIDLKSLQSEKFFTNDDFKKSINILDEKEDALIPLDFFSCSEILSLQVST